MGKGATLADKLVDGRAKHDHDGKENGREERQDG
jgi:hypothetical protein